MQIEYITVPMSRLEVNTAQCHNLITNNLFRNNDINVTAICVHVDFSNDDLFQLHVSLQF